MVKPDCRDLRCAACAAIFQHQKGPGRPPTYCPECRLDRATAPRPRYTKTCTECGTAFTALVDWALVCGPRCFKVRRRRINPDAVAREYREHKRREQASEGYQRRKLLNAFKRALWRIRENRALEEAAAAQEARTLIPCATCGEPIGGDGKKSRKYCSKRCRDRSDTTLAVRRKAAAAHRVARRTRAIDRFDPVEVFDRDGWLCQICGVKTPKELRGKHRPRSPELDHVVPLSLGGVHSMANTQCACRSCNRSKSNRRIVGQIGLFERAVA